MLYFSEGRLNITPLRVAFRAGRNHRFQALGSRRKLGTGNERLVFWCQRWSRLCARVKSQRVSIHICMGEHKALSSNAGCSLIRTQGPRGERRYRLLASYNHDLQSEKGCFNAPLGVSILNVKSREYCINRCGLMNRLLYFYILPSCILLFIFYILVRECIRFV